MALFGRNFNHAPMRRFRRYSLSPTGVHYKQVPVPYKPQLRQLQNPSLAERTLLQAQSPRAINPYALPPARRVQFTHHTPSVYQQRRPAPTLQRAPGLPRANIFPSSNPAKPALSPALTLARREALIRERMMQNSGGRFAAKVQPKRDPFGGWLSLSINPPKAQPSSRRRGGLHGIGGTLRNTYFFTNMLRR